MDIINDGQSRNLKVVVKRKVLNIYLYFSSAAITYNLIFSA